MTHEFAFLLGVFVTLLSGFCFFVLHTILAEMSDRRKTDDLIVEVLKREKIVEQLNINYSMSPDEPEQKNL